MTLVLVVLLPLFGAAIPLLAARRSRDAAALSALALTASSLGLLLSQAGAVLGGETLHAAADWIPALGWNASLMLDGLGLLFALLILGIGLLIVVYARSYLPESDGLGRFYCYLLLFMGAMLGVVIADNMLVLVAFWELTSISSFLLIGYWQHTREGREGARMALAVTGAGGLALLGGVLILGSIVGSYDLSVVLQARALVQAHSLHGFALGLVLLGAFTKSAQFPFHFWLPHAMAAPTPVSAYLHSATMVKAGVFLLARMSPIFAGTEGWLLLVGGAGLATMLLAAYWAIFKTDLKALLAYSTISHLGLITFLLGIGSPLAAVAAVFHILNHCAFKAALFMTAGIVDHETGTRDIRLLGGLNALMPVTTLLATIAAVSMAGAPPLNGFLSKEMLLEESLHVHVGSLPAWLVPTLVTLAALLSVVYSIRLIRETFFGRRPESYPRTPHEPPRGMRLPVEILVVLCVVIGLFPAALAQPLVASAATAAAVGEVPEFHLALWHGLNLPLLMSMIALAGGAVLYGARLRLFAIQGALPRVVAKRLYDGSLTILYNMASAVTFRLQNGSLQQYLLLLLGTALVFGAWPFWRLGIPALGPTQTPADATTLVAWAMLVVAAVATAAFHRRRLVALVILGVVGLVVTLGFVHFSAPDLALTQVSVEFVTIVMILMALQLLPKQTPRESGAGRRTRDLLIAGIAGVGVTGITWAILTRPLETISDYYLETSVPGGGGHNVVNVILVDFRGFDTFGEISVLAIAALGIYALVDGLGIGQLMPGRSELQDEDKHPLILAVVARLLLPVALMVSVFMFLRGHNEPGGGFIAALVTAAALIAQYVAFGVAWTHRRLPAEFRPMIGVGLLLAGLTGMGSWAYGAPFLTSAHGHFHLPFGDVELATAMFFDLGVYLTVVGAVLLVLANMSKLDKRELLLARARERARADIAHETIEREAAERRTLEEGEV
jgi:multicomponent K+:H+ antiporter subunit A